MILKRADHSKKDEIESKEYFPSWLKVRLLKGEK